MKNTESGMTGPLKSPMHGYLVNKPNLNPPCAHNTTMPGTAPKAAPIVSPLRGQVNIGRKSSQKSRG